MQAACYGHLTCVMLLVQYKADVKLCNNWGASALVGAAQGGFGTVVQVGCTRSVEKLFVYSHLLLVLVDTITIFSS